MSLAEPARRQLLSAMGYTLWQSRGASPERVVLSVAPAASPTPAAIATEPVDPLWAALARAAGLPAEATEAAGWRSVRAGPAFEFDGALLRIHLAALRFDVDARRRLWRTLRVLRRQQLDAQ